MWGALSDKRMGLYFSFVDGTRQRSLFRVQVLRDSWPYFTVSNLRLRQPRGPGPRFFYHIGRGWPSYTSGNGFPLCRFLRLTGLWWRYSTSLHTGVGSNSRITCWITATANWSYLGMDHVKNAALHSHFIAVIMSTAVTTWLLLSHCLATDIVCRAFH
jgi:hypothetical protein